MTKIKVYTSDFCAFCTQAKMLLTQLGLAFEEIDLSNDPETRLRLSQENNGYRTVPMIFIDDEFIGGYQELRELQKTGELSKKVHP